MASEDLNFTENLIKNVKKFPVLYDMSDPHYKNYKIKNKKWAEIANILNIEGIGGDDLRKKWKNLRDNYSKHLKSKKIHTGQERKFISSYKTWPWAQQMESFRPFIRFARTHSNISCSATLPDPLWLNDYENNTNIDESISEVQGVPSPASVDPEQILKNETTETSYTTSNNITKKRKITESNRSPPSIIHFLKTRQSAIYRHEESDEIDKTFNGYAAAVKKLTPRRQTIIKYQIAKLLMNAELEQQMEIEKAVTIKTPKDLASLSNTTSCSNFNIGSPQYYSNPPSVSQTESSSSAQSWCEHFTG